MTIITSAFANVETPGMKYQGKKRNNNNNNNLVIIYIANAAESDQNIFNRK